MPLNTKSISSHNDRRDELESQSYHKTHALYSVGKRAYLPSNVCKIKPIWFLWVLFWVTVADEINRTKEISEASQTQILGRNGRSEDK